jgi:hypothetical protein
MPIRGSPRLIAAYHVLHRLCMPRHPPIALISLDRSHCQCSSSSRSEGTAITVTFYNRNLSTTPSTCSIRSPHEGTPVHFGAGSLRPASRDTSGGARSGNANQTTRQKQSLSGSPTPDHPSRQASFLNQPLRRQRSARSSNNVKRNRPQTPTTTLSQGPSSTPGSLQIYLLFTM